MNFVSVNFQQTALVSVFDRAVSFGDGVFTTGLIYNSRLLMHDAHLERLQRSVQQLQLGDIDWRAVAEEIALAAEHQEYGVLKVIISAGTSKRGYARDTSARPTVIVQTSNYPQHYGHWRTEGIRMATAKTQLGINPLLAKIKHLNRLEQVLIRQELEQRAVDELLVTDINGVVIECSSANVFWRENGIWYTPKIVHAGVEGLIRQRLLRHLNAQQVTVEAQHLSAIDAMFICNSVLGVAPVIELNGKKLGPEQALVSQLNQWLME
ncbi:aminodeoxychorismate lyase [Thalassotalea ponticola]|uniref:aminodeoxychorismate lyase n=1 Tax=Thalassotalea ponticola TaxID=1523392 RepID=UPI0025B37968|nr:aminodeoxychorismate lyase [Thalassotalea ponticola]MDN3652725.1 aminodeoxychorismate lyase [Thalassotalea ponticola]